MKNYKFISVLSALFLGLFISCEQPSQNKQISITWVSSYDKENVPKTKYVDKGYKLTAEDLPELSVANQKFNGWMNNGSKANVGQEVYENTNLIAEWELNKYTITFITKIGTNPEPVTFDYGKNYLLDSKKLSQKGYIFLGWSFTENGSIIEDTSITIDKDITLYAVWEKIQKKLNSAWTIDYNSNPEKFSRTDKIPYSDKSKYEKITLQLEKYTGAFSDSWEFEDSENPYTVYLNGTEIIISANVTDPDEKIVFAEDCSMLFSDFSGVKEFIFPSKIDTSNVTKMNDMFLGCSSLSSLDLSNFDTSNVENMSQMFCSCENLTTLNISSFNTSKVTDMGQMFDSCKNLTSLEVSQFNTSNVTNMKYMFDCCNNLSTLDVSNFNTSKVTDMSGMFYSCNNLTSLDVSNFDTSNVTDMWGMFYSCNNLTSLDVSNFDTSNVTDMSKMFSSCNKLTSLDVSKFKTSNVTDMSGMFFACSFTTLDVSHFDTSKVTTMRTMFRQLTNLENLDVSNFDTSNVTDMWSMFSSCNKLTSLDVSHFNTSKVTDMSNMFASCKKINYLDISSFETSNVTKMDSLFNNCENLQCIFASDKFTTANVTSGENVFTGDNKLIGYDTNPASGENQYRHEVNKDLNTHHHAVIYKTGDGTPFSGQNGFFTDVAIKDEVLDYLKILQPAE